MKSQKLKAEFKKIERPGNGRAENGGMFTPFAAGLLVFGVLAGCTSSASQGWTKPGATEEQVNRDSADCQFNAQSMAPGGVAPGVSRGPGMVVDQDRYRQCMASRGYTVGPTK